MICARNFSWRRSAFACLSLFFALRLSKRSAFAAGVSGTGGSHRGISALTSPDTRMFGFRRISVLTVAAPGRLSPGNGRLGSRSASLRAFLSAVSRSFLLRVFAAICCLLAVPTAFAATFMAQAGLHSCMFCWYPRHVRHIVCKHDVEGAQMRTNKQARTLGSRLQGAGRKERGAGAGCLAGHTNGTLQRDFCRPCSHLCSGAFAFFFLSCAVVIPLKQVFGPCG